MKPFETWLNGLNNPAHRERAEHVFAWMAERYPQLAPVLKWNQPMYTEHGTFIMGFSASGAHMAVAAEADCLNRFRDALEQAGYSCSKELLRIRWEQPVPFALLAQMIDLNRLEKASTNTFWRKS